MNIDILEQINRSSLRFLQPLTPEATFEAIVKEALKLVKGDEGYIALIEDSELKIKYAYPPTLASIKMRRRGFSYRGYVQKRAFVTYVEDFKDIHPELVEAGIQSTIFIPLAYKEKSIGVLNIMSKHRTKRFSQKELSILKLFGSLASLAIRKTQAYSETKAALETRDLFISMAAHELRTPLTSINGYTQLLRSKLSGSDSIESKWVEQLYWETTRLTKLVNELLEINRIKSGKFHYFLKECSLREIINRVYSDLRFLYPSKEIEVEDKLEGKSDMVIGDYDKIIQVLTNLVDNAFKFSSPDTKINLSLMDKNSDLIIAVEDQGIGISKQDKSRVLEGFHQGRGHNKEGMGLGLYLVKDIVSKLHGKLKIRSKVNKGTIIEVFLPKFI